MAAEIKFGSYTGTGAAINIELGWEPDAVFIVNATDKDAAWLWTSSMTDAHAANLATGAALTSNGVTPYDAADFTNPLGFTVGSTLSESAKVHDYIAIRTMET